MALAFQVSAQTKIMHFGDPEDAGITVKQLDAQFKSAIHSDTTLAVFKSKDDQSRLISSYRDFLKAMGMYLRKSAFEWEEPLRLFNRFYFNPQGEVAYYVYNFQGPSARIAEKDRDKFEEVISAFFKTHTLGIKASRPYAQCSPVTFQ